MLASIVDGRKAANASDACNLNLSETIVDAKDALFQAQRNIPQLPDRSDDAKNWTRGAVPLRDWDLRRSGQTCTSDNLFAYRKMGTWFLRAGVTNNPVDAFMPDYERQFVDEYIPRDWSDALRLPHVRYGGGPVENATTIIARFGGIPGLASVSVMVFDENPALTEALRLNAIAVDQAKDAVTLSNIAILALPIVMTLFPVAFLADLNTFAMLCYIVFTDIFSALPFMIKGFELLDSAATNRGEAVAYHAGNETLGQMEVWAAECHGEDSFRVMGIVFVIVAAVAMVGGVLLEVVAAGVMRRRRAVNKNEASGPFGMALFEGTRYAPLGSAKQEDWERRLSEEMAPGRWSYDEADFLKLPDGHGATGKEILSLAERADPEAPSRRWRWVPWRRGERDEVDGEDSRTIEEYGDEEEVGAAAMGTPADDGAGDKWIVTPCRITPSARTQADPEISRAKSVRPHAMRAVREECDSRPSDVFIYSIHLKTGDCANSLFDTNFKLG
ncbi:unnamed protein product [Chondrus crispus]|uniref:Uncharacterized protein n=1 Tax=Chondrus crispus TaxID=2769 RepID=R7QLA2_CHOCR|nr:unnamed protein product [Chondrus crispus]CDF39292.1 unnamed protein product [Chondrus crispus]|eukprot:XP_005719203.1 unnamed protein product [Chondrus crispus]